MATWPGSLPQQLEMGAQESRQSGFLRTEMDTGPYKQRKRFTAVTRFWSGTMLMTTTQKQTFETFFTSTINQGADEFEFLDPNDQSVVSARFVSPPQSSALVGGTSGTGLWRITIELELLP